MKALILTTFLSWSRSSAAAQAPEILKKGSKVGSKSSISTLVGLNWATFGGTILSSAFKEQTIKWEPMTREYVSNIIMVVHRFLCMALGKVCANRQLYDRVWASIIDELLERYKTAMSQALFLLSVERNRRPYTLNDYFTDNLQKMRGARVAKMLEGNARGEMRKNDNGYWASSSNKVVDLEAVKEAAINQGNVEHVKEEIHDILWSYYKVSRKRFVDSVYMQAVEHCLLTGPDSRLKLSARTGSSI